MVEVDEDAETGIRCGTTDERGQKGQTESGATTTTKGEEANTKIGKFVRKLAKRDFSYDQLGMTKKK